MPFLLFGIAFFYLSYSFFNNSICLSVCSLLTAVLRGEFRCDFHDYVNYIFIGRQAFLFSKRVFKRKSTSTRFSKSRCLCSPWLYEHFFYSTTNSKEGCTALLCSQILHRNSIDLHSSFFHTLPYHVLQHHTTLHCIIVHIPSF